MIYDKLVNLEKYNLDFINNFLNAKTDFLKEKLTLMEI